MVRNIGAFGGDPNNVTAFGESAGAGALLHLLASTARLPIRRCILQSPGVDHTLRTDQGELVTEVLVRHLGGSGLDLTRLRAVPAEAILAAQEKTVAELMPVVSAMPFHPVVDGDLLLTTPSVAFADGAAVGIDLMVSWTAEEMRLFPNPAADDGGIEAITDWTRALLTRRLGETPHDATVCQLVAFYQDRSAAIGERRPAELWSSILTDGVMRLPCRRIADSHSSNGGTPTPPNFPGADQSQKKSGMLAPFTPLISPLPSGLWTDAAGGSSSEPVPMPISCAPATWRPGATSPGSGSPNPLNSPGGPGIPPRHGRQ